MKKEDLVQLIEKSLLFYKNQIWTKIWDSMIFAVELHDKEIAYISILGNNDMDYGIGIYVGKEGYNDLIDTFTQYDSVMYANNIFDTREFVLSKSFLKVSLEDILDLSDENYIIAKKVKNKVGLKKLDKTKIPFFYKMESYKLPCNVEDKKEIEYLNDVLDACNELNEIFKANANIPIKEINEKTKKISILRKVNGKYELNGEISLPKYEKKVQKIVVNELDAKRLSKMKKNEFLEVKLIMSPNHVMDGKDQNKGYFPFLLFFADEKRLYEPVLSNEYNLCRITNFFIFDLVHKKINPKKILVNDERTKAIVDSFASIIGAKVVDNEKLEILDNALNQIAHMTTDGYDEDLLNEDNFIDSQNINPDKLDLDFMIKFLVDLPQNDFNDLPIEVFVSLSRVFSEIPEKDRAKIKKKIDAFPSRLIKNLFEDIKLENRKNSNKITKTKKKKGETIFYVISVKLGTGCYRHIRVPEGTRLDVLVDVILDIFGFYNDHAHAYFMNNRIWTDTNCYYMKEVDEFDEYDHTDEFTVDVLEEKQKFALVFDFGEEWVFRCNVLKTIVSDKLDPDEIEVIKEVGTPPEQYGYFNEDDYDE